MSTEKVSSRKLNSLFGRHSVTVLRKAGILGYVPDDADSRADRASVAAEGLREVAEALEKRYEAAKDDDKQEIDDLKQELEAVADGVENVSWPGMY